MSPSDDRSEWFDDLRSEAEDLLSRQSEERARVPSDMLTLIEELRLHQAELSIQNQQLRESQEAREVLHREYSDLYDNAPCAYVTIDSKGIVQRINRAAVDLFAIESEFVRHSEFSRFVCPQSDPDYRMALQSAVESGETAFCELKTRNGRSETTKWIRAAVSARFYVTGEFEEWRLAAIDISRRVELEADLNGLVSEKAFLLRELSHRIKNNLTLVVSMIRLKNAEIGDQADLSDLVNRVMSIASVYKQLQISDRPTVVPFRGYVHSLLSSVFDAETGGGVNIVTDAAETLVETGLAIKLGLIISELATNAVKHGFDASVRAEFGVQIELDPKQHEYTLRVSNNGRSFPADFDLENTRSFGLQFVRAILVELDGRLSLDRFPLPVFTIVVPVPAR